MDSLIKRLQEAESGSRDLDDSVIIRAYDGEMMDWWDEEAQQHQIKAADGSRVNVTPVTTSLDAIVALIGEKLPGWDWELTGRGWAMVDRPDTLNDENIATAKTPALALCIALLSALQSQEPTP